jgi:thiol:disulfide interchange protein DsbD
MNRAVPAHACAAARPKAGGGAALPRLAGRVLPVVLAGIALLAATPAAHAQLGGRGVPPAGEILKPFAAPVTIAAGGRAVVEVRLMLMSGWHANANPPSPDYMIPTEIVIPPSHGLRAGAPEYPPAMPVKLGFEEQPISVYDGTVTVRVPLAAAADAETGRHSIAAEVRFQACNDQVCLPPASVPLALTVTVTGGAPAGGPAAADSGAGPQDGAAAGADSAVGAPVALLTHDGTGAGAGAAGDPASRLRGALEKGGLWWFLALFVGGLALNLTPCVFPMIGVTVSVFGARRREPAPRVLAHALAYVLGIAVTYSVLGVIAALTGGLFGAALQNPWVNVGIGVLFLVLSLSMFGLYEMQPPAWLLLRLGGANASSIAGIFLSGLAVGIIAAPCVGPFVVAVLALIAQRGDAGFGFQTMFALSLGLGFPYLFLALFSNLLQSLPRSGDWMLWVKQVFGVLLAGIGLYFALLGLAPAAAPWVLPVALVLGGIYLGFVSRHGAARRGFRAFKAATGALAVVGGVAMAMVLRAEGVRFQPYDEAAVSAALANGQPVLMDFSADWCLPCHELDRYTFTDRRVIEASRRFAAFKVDLTRYDSPEAQALRRRFGVTGVPEVLFFTPDGREAHELRVVGFMPAAPFLERMRAVSGS